MGNRLPTLLLVAWFALTATAFAQVPNITDVTSTPVPGVGHSKTRGGRHALGLSIFGQSVLGLDGNCNNAGLTLSTSGSDGPILATTNQVPNNASGVPGTFELEPVTVTTADGTHYQFPYVSGTLLTPTDPATVLATSVEDKNGNTVSINSSASNVTYTDTLGRSAVSLTRTSSSQDSIAVSGLSGPVVVTWGSQPYSFNVTMTHVAGTQACTENTNSASDSEIQSIVLPNGDTYSFGYDPTTGLVNSVSYPGGGVVTYTVSAE